MLILVLALAWTAAACGTDGDDLAGSDPAPDTGDAAAGSVSDTGDATAGSGPSLTDLETDPCAVLGPDALISTDGFGSPGASNTELYLCDYIGVSEPGAPENWVVVSVWPEAFAEEFFESLRADGATAIDVGGREALITPATNPVVAPDFLEVSSYVREGDGYIRIVVILPEDPTDLATRLAQQAAATLG